MPKSESKPPFVEDKSCKEDLLDPNDGIYFAVPRRGLGNDELASISDQFIFREELDEYVPLFLNNSPRSTNESSSDVDEYLLKCSLDKFESQTVSSLRNDIITQLSATFPEALLSCFERDLKSGPFGESTPEAGFRREDYGESPEPKGMDSEPISDITSRRLDLDSDETPSASRHSESEKHPGVEESEELEIFGNPHSQNGGAGEAAISSRKRCGGLSRKYDISLTEGPFEAADNESSRVTSDEIPSKQCQFLHSVTNAPGKSAVKLNSSSESAEKSEPRDKTAAEVSSGSDVAGQGKIEKNADLLSDQLSIYQPRRRKHFESAATNCSPAKTTSRGSGHTKENQTVTKEAKSDGNGPLAEKKDLTNEPLMTADERKVANPATDERPQVPTRSKASRKISSPEITISNLDKSNSKNFDYKLGDRMARFAVGVIPECPEEDQENTISTPKVFSRPFIDPAQLELSRQKLKSRSKSKLDTEPKSNVLLISISDEDKKEIMETSVNIKGASNLSVSPSGRTGSSKGLDVASHLKEPLLENLADKKSAQSSKLVDPLDWAQYLSRDFHADFGLEETSSSLWLSLSEEQEKNKVLDSKAIEAQYSKTNSDLNSWPFNSHAKDSLNVFHSECCVLFI